MKKKSNIERIAEGYEGSLTEACEALCGTNGVCLMQNSSGGVVGLICSSILRDMIENGDFDGDKVRYVDEDVWM